MDRHSRIRKTDLDRINAWIAANPEKAWAALLAQGLEPLTISRIISGKQQGLPRPSTRKMFARAASVAESFFFPFADEKQSA